MIYLLHGGDWVSLEETLSKMKKDVEPEELRDVNITTFTGPEISFEELNTTCQTIPFLGNKRMIIVRGLMDQKQRPGRKPSSAEKPSRGEWENLPVMLRSIPDTTDLVFVNGKLETRNILLQTIKNMGDTITFPVPRLRELPLWILNRAKIKGVGIDPRAASSLSNMIGLNLRIIDAELEKLSVYCDNKMIQYKDVLEMVSYVKQGNIFVAVDSVIEQRPDIAVTQIHKLVDEGYTPGYIISMIARQVRLILLTKAFKAKGVQHSELGNKLSLSGYPLQKTLEQEPRVSPARLTRLHRKLLEADADIKNGSSINTILEILIVELAT